MGVKIREKPKGSGEWWVYIIHRGKRKSKKIGDKKLAMKIAKQIEARLLLGDVGIVEEKQSPTLSEYAKIWIETVVHSTCKPSTQSDYRGILKNHILPEFRNKQITSITRGMVKKFLMKKYDGGNGLAQSTVTHIKNALGGIFGMAIDDEILNSNPAHHLGRIFNKGKSNKLNTIDPLTRSELTILLNVFKNHFPQHYPLMLCLSRTGLRIGEATALKWSDLDFNGRFITVQRNISRGRIGTPKNDKIRKIDMSLQLSEVLFRLKRERGDSGDDWVFKNEAGNPIDGCNWRHRVFNKALDMAGLRRVRVHDIRHSYATILIQNGESLAYIQSQLGHHSIKVTCDVYGHLVPGANKEAVDKLDDELEFSTNNVVQIAEIGCR